ncbi:MAG: hypothetical protein K2X38_24930 [Gemmataceae bacterium]|nr:hypothetical protein [Gemmataceae bacterium]
MGDIAVRDDGPGCGIRLDPGEDSWACFAECKWYRDLSINVVNDIERNQLTRVVENVLCFQHYDAPFRHFVHRPAFTMITPRCFVLDKNGQKSLSRLFQYTYREYHDHREAAMLRDIRGFQLERRNEDRWQYPSDQHLSGKASRLYLHWVTYDELFDQLPPSPLRQETKKFWNEHGGYQGRAG